MSDRGAGRGADPAGCLPEVLATERLRLPLWSADDVAAIRAGVRRPGWHADYPRRDDQDAAGLWVQGDPWGPRHLVRGVTALGSIGFFGPPTEAADGVPEAEVGYGLVPDARGYGFATEALAALLSCTDAGGVRVRASVDPTNRPSVRVLAACRFTGLRGSDEDGHLVMVRPLPPAAPVPVVVPGSGGDLVTDLPRLVATDLDGTLVRTDGSVSDYTAGVLVELERRGVPTVFVTGRPLRWAEVVFPHVGAHGLAIVSNGAVVWDVAASRASLERPIDPDVALRACRAIRDAVPGTTYAVEDLGGIGLEPDFMERYPMPDGARRAPVEELLARPVHKILARHEELGPEEFWRAAEEVTPGLLTVTWSSSSTLLEMSAAGVTKATTLAMVCADLGVEAADVIAFGDMPNDLPMLTWAGASYAMADAHPTVVEAAQHVAPGHDEDGVAQVLAQVFGL